MAENSNIEWTTHTFNPWMGCAKVSHGCKNCYAEAMFDHRLQQVKWGMNGVRKKTSPSNWAKPRMWNRRAKAGNRRDRVFCASLADVFEAHPTIQAEWRAELWKLMEETPHLDWLVLTKRPESIAFLVPKRWLDGDWPNNVWVGTSVENQQRAEERIPQLLEIPAPVRFLSCEPLLESVDLTQWLDDSIDWVIAGGESGSNARPMEGRWARSLRDQCRFYATPFFFKQWGEFNPRGIRVGKKKAGRLLDGATWEQTPRKRGGQ